MKRTITLSAPDIGPDERELVSEVLVGSALSFGPKLVAFEREFAARVGARHAVAVSSGTAGLHMAVIASGASEGDFVITSPFSFVASANAALYERAVPLFLDVDPETLMLDSASVIDAAESIAKRRRGWKSLLPRSGAGKSGRLRALLPVHVFGRPMETASIAAAAREMNVWTIEDACEVVGASVDGRPVGTTANATVFAFYPNKQMTTGEGGMIVTDDDDSAALFRSLRNQGRDEDGRWLRHVRLGYNYRLDEMSAAVGLAQLRRIDELLARRNEVARQYGELLRNVEGVRPLSSPRAGVELSWFVYIVRVDDGIDRDALMARLEERGVPTRPYFSPIHLQPMYVERFGYRPGDFPVTERAGKSLLALPFHGALTSDDLEYVVEQIRAELPNARIARRPALESMAAGD